MVVQNLTSWLKKKIHPKFVQNFETDFLVCEFLFLFFETWSILYNTFVVHWRLRRIENVFMLGGLFYVS